MAVITTNIPRKYLGEFLADIFSDLTGPGAAAGGASAANTIVTPIDASILNALDVVDLGVETNPEELLRTLEIVDFTIEYEATGSGFDDADAPTVVDNLSFILPTFGGVLYRFDGAFLGIEIVGQDDAFIFDNSALDTFALGQDDTLRGTSDRDDLFGASGADRLLGLSGDDTLNGSSGDDLLKGGAGADRLIGNGGDDTVKGGGGDDNIKGNGGDDNIKGNGGSDVIKAGGGDDTVKGGGGADVINGGGGSDLLQGGGGNDTITGKGGDDTLKGNGGADVFQFRASDRNDTILDFRQGQDLIEIQNGVNSFAGLSFEQDGRDVLIGFGAGQVRVVTDSVGAFDEDDFIF